MNPSYSVVMQEFKSCINDHNESESFQLISSIPACLCEIFKARIFEIRYLIVHLALSVRYLLEIRRQSSILGHACYENVLLCMNYNMVHKKNQINKMELT